MNTPTSPSRSGGRRLRFWLTALVFLALGAQGQSPADAVRQADKPAQAQLLEVMDEATASTSPAASVDADSADATKTVRISPGATLYIRFTPKTDDASAALIPRRQLFVLDDQGYLTLDTIGTFALAGLDENEAELRLRAEPVFTDTAITVKVLPVVDPEAGAVERFGSRLFAGPGKAQVLDNLPVPGEYRLGVGDEVKIQLIGAETTNESYTVTRDGILELPQLGPVVVAGTSVDETKQQLAALYAQKLIGVEAHISMGALRSVQVRVLGDVVAPGSYVLGSLSSVVDALEAAGGISDIGSYRQVNVRRGGQLIAQVDLYDLLLKGTVEPLRLYSGDTVFVPVAGSQVALTGRVRRPAIYELQAGETLRNLLVLAGGLLSDAWADSVQVRRTSAAGQQLLEASLDRGEDRQMRLQDGDRVTVRPRHIDLVQQVRITGEVLQAGEHAWHSGMRAADLLAAADLKRAADRAIALLVRVSAEGRPQLLDFSPQEALSARQTDSDPLLQAGDQLMVFSRATPGQRSQLLRELIDQLERQIYGQVQLVSVAGAVAEPGDYPLTAHMRISTLLALAGSVQPAGGHVPQQVELSRTTTDPDGNPLVSHSLIPLADITSGQRDPLLSPWDTVTLQRDPRFSNPLTVQLAGEVRFPGSYRLAPGEQLSGLLERAGGLTTLAFPEGAVLVRDSLSKTQKQELTLLADQIELGLKATILERADETLRPGESLQVAADVVTLLRGAEPMGRLVFDLPTLLAESTGGRISDADLTLFDGDRLYIPPVSETVSVVGEVNRPASHVYQSRLAAMDYVALSGGLTTKSKRKLIYIVRADGSARSIRGGWNADRVAPGDTIVVPLNVERIHGLKRWSDLTTIIANLVSPTAAMVTAAAAWKSAEANADRDIIIAPR